MKKAVGWGAGVAALLAVATAVPAFATDPVWANKGHTVLVAGIEFAPNGSTLVTTGADGVKLWFTDTGKMVAGPKTDGPATHRAVIADYTRIVASWVDGQTVVKLWGGILKKEVTLTHEKAVEQVLFPPSGYYVITRSADHIVRVWAAQTGKEVFRTDAWYVVLSPTGGTLALIRDDQTVVLLPWLNEKGTLIPGVMGTPVFSRDGKLVAMPTKEGRMKVWDVATGEERADLGLGTRARFTPDGAAVVVLYQARTTVWDAKTWKVRASIEGEGEVSPDGKLFATRKDEKTAEVWDLETCKVRLTVPLPAGDSRFWPPKFHFSGDSRTLAILLAGCAPTWLEVWDVAAGKLLLHDDAHVLAYSPSGQYLATGYLDGSVRLWDLDALRKERKKCVEKS
jgi:WD40 repeat protein